MIAQVIVYLFFVIFLTTIDVLVTFALKDYFNIANVSIMRGIGVGIFSLYLVQSLF